MKTGLTSAVIATFIAAASLMIGTHAVAQEDIDAHRSCAFCGMDRKAFGYSRMLVRYDDGSEVGVCSLHCAVIELEANKARRVTALLVADRDSRNLLEAEQAFWVAGGSKRGVMTEHPSWAFSTKAAAEAFIKQYGGTLTPWDDVRAAARDEVARERR
jgi:nitrous oxide reductase accessory protein NosL